MLGRLFSRYGAELMNVCVGLLSWPLLGLLWITGDISSSQWRLWMLLSLSFVVLPFLLIGGRLASPALEESMNPKLRTEPTSPADTASKSPPAQAPKQR